jgi:hypothetical protein
MQSWKEFRESLTENCLQDVVDYWSSWGITARKIDPFNLETWPTAWELVDSGEVCDYSVALGMAYTLVYSSEEWRNRVELVMSQTQNYQALLVIIDNSEVLNYSYREVKPKEEIDINPVKTFIFTGKKFEIRSN